MQFSKRTLSNLAEMICGSVGGGTGYQWENFCYRSSTYLTEFFTNCDLDYVHDGSTRKWWVLEVLEELNSKPASSPHLPPDVLVRVIQELLDPVKFVQESLDREKAIEDLNTVLGREGLAAFTDKTGTAQLRNIGTNTQSTSLISHKKSWSRKEAKRREEITFYLSQASEDEFIEQVLYPLFRQLGFVRISITGHKDKSLEFGKDMWMKLQLPTQHFIYFGAQVKRNKLNSAGKSKNTNISEVLHQIRMMMDHPIFDPETNRKHLLDHVFIISAGEITKAAKSWLAEHLDTSSRRHILFMDREDIVDLIIKTNLALPIEKEGAVTINREDDQLPF